MTAAGTPTAELGDPRLPPRFWAKIEVASSGCWLWTAYVEPKGYGIVRWSGKVRRAYRVAYTVLVGDPGTLEIDHLCHVRACCNPAHLAAKTHHANTENRAGAQARNRSGHRGVTWDRKSRKWRVGVTSNYVQHHGGFYDDLDVAAQAARDLRNSLMTHNLADRGNEHG